MSYSNKEGKLLVDLIQLDTHKTVMKLKTNSLVEQPINISLVNFLDSFRHHLIDHGHTFPGVLALDFQKICLDDEYQDDMENQGDSNLGAPVHPSDFVTLPGSSTGRNQKMTWFHQSIIMDLKPLFVEATTCFTENDYCRQYFFPVIFLYCTDILEEKHCLKCDTISLCNDHALGLGKLTDVKLSRVFDSINVSLIL